MKKVLLFVIAIVTGISMIVSQNVVDFEDLNLQPDSYWNGSDESGNFTSNYLKFYNNFTNFGDYTAWHGFAYSNMTDITTPGFGNQYSAASGKGVNNSSNYAVCYIALDFENDNSPIPSVLTIDSDNAPEYYRGMYISLNTYASLYMNQMLNGSSYEAEKYWLTLQIKAINSSTSEEVSKNYILADYRFETENGFKLTDWTYIDLSWADGKDSLNFIMNSNDTVGGFGINTPLYFCMDNFGADAPANIPQLAAEVKNTYTIDKGESVELSALVKGGMQPYSFTWSNETGLDNYNSQFPKANPSQTTTYTVTIKDAEGTEITKNVTVNVNNVNIYNSAFENLEIYSNSIGNIIISNSKVIDNVTIYDITGKVLLIEKPNSDNIEINTSYLPQGIYLVDIKSGKNQSIKKIMK